MKTIVIINPQAGNGRTEKIWPNIESALGKSIGSFEVLQTSCRGDEKDLSRSILAVDTVRIVAVGGDGHLNEVLNGFIENDLPVNPEARLSFVMTGTGCDFQRSLGISGKWHNAAAKLKDAKVRKIDVGNVTYTAANKTQKIRYFDNIASFGLSGAVDHCLEHSRLRNYLDESPLFLCGPPSNPFSLTQTRVSVFVLTMVPKRKFAQDTGYWPIDIILEEQCIPLKENWTTGCSICQC